jgi:hypothetical protein
VRVRGWVDGWMTVMVVVFGMLFTDRIPSWRWGLRGVLGFEGGRKKGQIGSGWLGLGCKMIPRDALEARLQYLILSV